MTDPERIFSGIQPTGRKHLGNYIGAIRQYVEGQDRGEAIYCVVDAHAITVNYDPQELRRSVYDTAAMLLAGVSACAGTSSSHRLQTRGISLYYETEGHGPPLLLIHGGMGNGGQFDKQRPAFAPTHRLIVPDCCAQGRTTDRPGPLTYHDMAEDMIALLDSLKLRRVDVMGWSDGANIGLDMAIHHPDRVDHLVTFGANASIEGLPTAECSA